MPSNRFKTIKPIFVFVYCIVLIIPSHDKKAYCQDSLFAEVTYYQTPGFPISLFICDIDADLDKDVAIACQSNSICFLKNNGDGYFQSYYSYQSSSEPSSIIMVDIDGDGDADAINTNSGSDNIQVWINRGDGSFLAPTNYEVGNGPTSVNTILLNGDNFVDLVITNYHSGDITILVNDGYGTFYSPQSEPVANFLMATYVEDLNGDLFEDIAVVGEGGGLYIFFNSGNDDIQFQQTYPTGIGSISVDGGDLDKDGGIDIAVANLGSNSISIFINDGSGDFSDTSSIFCLAPFDVKIGDINGDGELDILTTTYSDSGAIEVFLNLGNAVFVQSEIVDSLNYPTRMYLADMDYDEDKDLFCLAYSTGNLVTVRNITGPYCQIIPGDVNGDSVFNGIDVGYGVNYLKGFGPYPPDGCLCRSSGFVFASADANGSCIFNGLDLTYIVNYLKGAGGAPIICENCRRGQ